MIWIISATLSAVDFTTVYSIASSVVPITVSLGLASADLLNIMNVMTIIITARIVPTTTSNPLNFLANGLNFVNMIVTSSKKKLRLICTAWTHIHAQSCQSGQKFSTIMTCHYKVFLLFCQATPAIASMSLLRRCGRGLTSFSSCCIIWPSSNS